MLLLLLLTLSVVVVCNRFLMSHVAFRLLPACIAIERIKNDRFVRDNRCVEQESIQMHSIGLR